MTLATVSALPGSPTRLAGLLAINPYCQGAFVGGATLLAVLFDHIAIYRKSR